MTQILYCKNTISEGTWINVPHKVVTISSFPWKNQINEDLIRANLSVSSQSGAICLILFCLLLRILDTDMSPKPQPAPCDQRKDLALRRTGEISSLFVCDGVPTLRLGAVKVIGDFPFQVYPAVVYFWAVWVTLTQTSDYIAWWDTLFRMILFSVKANSH